MHVKNKVFLHVWWVNGISEYVLMPAVFSFGLKVKATVSVCQES